MSDILIDAARNAARHAYAPYSGFGVGAALLMADGSIIEGTNFENASYGLSLCAETVALATANAQGRLRDVREVAVIGGMIVDGAISGSDAVRPCGRCRHCASADGAVVEQHLLSTLLPYAFGPADLGR
jgi:cytidine deaminase